MIIEGKNPVKEALNSDDVTITKLLVQNSMHDFQDIVAQAKDKRIRIEFVDKSELDKLSESGRHQGLLAICDEYSYCSVDEIIGYAAEKGEKLFMLILDSIEDPHNLGSILRVAECAGVHGVVIPKHRACSVNSTVAKVSAGALAHIKIARVTNINDTIRELTDNFITVICADMDGDDMYSCYMTGDIALVIGGEGVGVKPLTRKLCDKAISIPQFGKVNSLNASVACGIVTYEVIRQRLKK